MMSKKLMLASVIAVAMSGTALAAGTAETDTTTNPAAVGESATHAPGSPSMLRASDVIGRDVVNAKGDEIGKIDDLVIQSGDTVMQAVISVGGFLGVGEKLVTVPFDELQVSPTDDDKVVYNATKEQLKAQPEFKYREAQALQPEGEAGRAVGAVPPATTEQERSN